MGSAPQVVMIAGPNGAGKTTASRRLLKIRGINVFVNADQIALGLSGLDPDVAAVTAGRLMLQTLRELAAERSSFAFETTLSSRSFAPWIKQLLHQGYEAHLDFFWVPNAEFSVRRVHSRHQSGGHFVPDEVVRRRYSRGIINFFDQYRHLVTSWNFWNNSFGGEPVCIASRAPGKMEDVQRPDEWEMLCATYASS